MRGIYLEQNKVHVDYLGHVNKPQNIPIAACRYRLVCVTWIHWISDATADADATARCAHSLK